MEIMDAYLIRSNSEQEQEALRRIEKTVEDSSILLSFKGMGQGFGNYILVGRSNIKKIKDLLISHSNYSLSLIDEIEISLVAL